MITDNDCYFPINGDTSYIEEYCKKNYNTFDFKKIYEDYNVYTMHNFDYETVRNIVGADPNLSRIDKILKISHCFIMKISPNSCVGWHLDIPRKGPVLNLMLTPEARSYSIFTDSLYNTSGIIECKYPPHQFVLYNTDRLHSITNFENPRSVFSVIFERGKTDLTWTEAIYTLSKL